MTGPPRDPLLDGLHGLHEDEEAVYRVAREPPLHTRRLMDTLGVRVEVTTASAHDVLTSRDCVFPGCPLAAENGDYCRKHVGQTRRTLEGTMNEGKNSELRDSIIAWIQQFTAAHGRTPTTDEYTFADDAPSSLSALTREFGGIGDATVAAGFERPARGRRVEPVIQVPVTRRAPESIRPLVEKVEVPEDETLAEQVVELRPLEELVRDLEAVAAEREEAQAALLYAETRLRVAIQSVQYHPTFKAFLDGSLVDEAA